MELHFGVDVDGVLAHHLPAMCEIVAEVTGKRVLPEEVRDYYFGGLIERELMEIVFTRCMECALELPPLDDHHLVNQLPGRVTIVTHRHADVAEEVTKAWLDKHGIRYDDIIFTRGPKSLTGSFDYFIDDAPHNALDLSSAGCTLFLMDQPYNRHLDGHERIVRVSGWREVRDYLCERRLWGDKGLS